MQLWDSPARLTGLLHLQKLRLPRKAACIAGQRAMGPHHAMARNNQRNFIAPHRAAHCLRRNKSPAAPGLQLLGQLAVGNGFSVWDCLQQRPYLPLKRTALRGQGKIDRRVFPAK